MHNNKQAAAWLLIGIIICLFPFFSTGAEGGEPDIKDIVVCNVYWENYKDMNLLFLRISKFVVTFSAGQPAAEYRSKEVPVGHQGRCLLRYQPKRGC